MIAAIGESREIGKDNELLWDIPEDLRRFKELTNGHPVIMGRKTYESIGKPLPGRTNIVLSRTKQEIRGAVVVTSIEEALDVAGDADGSEEIFVIGGANVYEQFIDQTDRLYLTVVHRGNPSADAFFPPYSAFESVVSEKAHFTGQIPFTYLILEK